MTEIIAICITKKPVFCTKKIEFLRRFKSSTYNHCLWTQSRFLIFCIYWVLGVTLKKDPTIFKNVCSFLDILNNKKRPICRFFLYSKYLKKRAQFNGHCFFSYTKYYLPTINQKHLMISTWVRACRKFHFLRIKQLASL